MNRYVALFGIVASLACCDGALADPPKNDTSNAAIVERLDEIMRRLDSIEMRLVRVEDETRLNSNWKIDDHGVMRLPNGQAIGFWGIDCPMMRTMTIRK